MANLPLSLNWFHCTTTPPRCQRRNAPLAAKERQKSCSGPLLFFPCCVNIALVSVYFYSSNTCSNGSYAYYALFSYIAKTWADNCRMRGAGARKRLLPLFPLPFGQGSPISVFFNPYITICIVYLPLLHLSPTAFAPPTEAVSSSSKPPPPEYRLRTTKKEGPASLPVPLLKSCEQDCASVKSPSPRPAR
ncbi:hypothetical protein HMPREF0262_02914 [Clostridium sp. ATCC 29733]|nr:hypothetical protein HMPREF0262_02914 [Clostridium sp. ATCC 29733]